MAFKACRATASIKLVVQFLFKIPRVKKVIVKARINQVVDFKILREGCSWNMFIFINDNCIIAIFAILSKMNYNIFALKLNSLSREWGENWLYDPSATVYLERC